MCIEVWSIQRAHIPNNCIPHSIESKEEPTKLEQVHGFAYLLILDFDDHFTNVISME